MRFIIRSPFEFFQKAAPIKESLVILLVSTGIFVVFNELSIRYGFTNYVPKAGPLESMTGNFILIIIGFFIVSTALYLMSMAIKKKISVQSSAFIVSYSFAPLLIGGWIPIGFVTAIIGILSFFYMFVGTHIVSQASYKKTFGITLMEFFILATLITTLTVFL